MMNSISHDEQKRITLNQNIDWDFLAAMGYIDEHDIEAKIPSEHLPSVQNNCFLEHGVLTFIRYQQHPELHSTVSLLFWAADTSPMVLGHLLRLCKQYEYPIDLNPTYLAQNKKNYSLLYYLTLGIARGEYQEILMSNLFKEDSNFFYYYQESQFKEKVVELLLKEGVSPNGQQLVFENFNLAFQKKIDAFGYNWKEEHSLNIGKSICNASRYFKINQERLHFLIDKGAQINDDFYSLRHGFSTSQDINPISHYSYLSFLITLENPFSILMANELIQQGADIHHLNEFQQNTWHLLASYINERNFHPFAFLKRMSYLKKHLVDINQQDVFGKSPLHVLVEKSDSNLPQVIRWFYQMGADITLKDCFGKTAEEQALLHQNFKSAQVLFDLNAQENRKKLEHLPFSKRKPLLLERL